MQRQRQRREARSGRRRCSVASSSTWPLSRDRLFARCCIGVAACCRVPTARISRRIHPSASAPERAASRRGQTRPARAPCARWPGERNNTLSESAAAAFLRYPRRTLEFLAPTRRCEAGREGGFFHYKKPERRISGALSVHTHATEQQRELHIRLCRRAQGATEHVTRPHHAPDAQRPSSPSIYAPQPSSGGAHSSGALFSSRLLLWWLRSYSQPRKESLRGRLFLSPVLVVLCFLVSAPTELRPPNSGKSPRRGRRLHCMTQHKHASLRPVAAVTVCPPCLPGNHFALLSDAYCELRRQSFAAPTNKAAPLKHKLPTFMQGGNAGAAMHCCATCRIEKKRKRSRAPARGGWAGESSARSTQSRTAREKGEREHLTN